MLFHIKGNERTTQPECLDFSLLISFVSHRIWGFQNAVCDNLLCSIFKIFIRRKQPKNRVLVFRLFLLHLSWEDPSFPHMKTPGHSCARAASPHSLYRACSDPANICSVLQRCLPTEFFTPKQKRKKGGRKIKKAVAEYLEKRPPNLNTG